MRLNKTDREEFRKNVKILILQTKNSEIVYPFKKKVTPRKSINDSINRLQQGWTVKEPNTNRSGRPTSWTSTRKKEPA